MEGDGLAEEMPPARYERQRRVNRAVERELQRRRELHRNFGNETDSSDESNNDNQSARSSQSEADDMGEVNDMVHDGEVGGDEIMEINESEGEDDSLGGDGDEVERIDTEESADEAANDMGDGEFLREVLRRWAADGGAASMSKLDLLLRNLAVRFPEIPLSYKTLLQTPRRTEVTPLHHGSILWYKGIRANLDSMDLNQYLARYGRIEIDVGIDGVQLSRSSQLKFWPIVGCLTGSKNPPFVIAIYLGEKDPNDVYAYLEDFVLELEELYHNGYLHNNVVYPFSVRDFIGDAPARSFLKCCVYFNSFYSCERCCVRGEFVADRMTYIDLEAAHRTDESYNNQEQAEHHIGISPLQEIGIGIGLVSQFPLDPLHLIFIGVFKRLLLVWTTWIGNFRLHRDVLGAISEKMMELKATCPSDFNRKIRSLSFMALYKATEFRRLCLYDSILVFRDHLNDNVYRHFLLLHVALYILDHPVLVLSAEWLDYADGLLSLFIRHSVEIYGAEFVVYNVHSLSHIVQECRNRNRRMIEFSAFKYETFMGTLKNSLKSFYRPCQQAACRITERMQFVRHVELPPENIEVSVSREYVNNNEIMPGRHFKLVKIGETVLQLNDKDNCFKTQNDDVVILNDIVQSPDGSIHLIGNCFTQKDDFFDYPLPSSRLGIFSLKNLEEQFVVVKFLPEDGREDETGKSHYAIGVTNWLYDLDPYNNEGRIYWPRKNISRCVTKCQAANTEQWNSFRVKIKRYKETQKEAQDYLNGVIGHTSNYETEAELGRGRRLKRQKKLTDTESDSGPPQKTLKLSTKPIPPPPCVNLKTPGLGITGARTQKTSKIENISKNHAKKVQKASEKTCVSRDNLLQKLQLRRESSAGQNSQPAKSISVKDQLEVKIAKSSKASKDSEVIEPNGEVTGKRTEPFTSSANDKLAEKIANVSKGSDKSKVIEPNGKKKTVPAVSSGKDHLAENISNVSKPSAKPAKGTEAVVDLSVLERNGTEGAHIQQNPLHFSNQSDSLEVQNVNSEAQKMCDNPEQNKLNPSLGNISHQSPTKSSKSNINHRKKSVSEQDSSDEDSFNNLGNQRLFSNKGQFSLGTGAPRPSSGSDHSGSPLTSNFGSKESVAKDSSDLQFSGGSGSDDDDDGDHHKDSGFDDRSRPGTPEHNVARVHNVSRTCTTSTGLEWIEKDILFLKTEVSELRKDVQEANLNIARLLRFLMPHEKKLQIPAGMPSLPLKTFDNFDKFEEFLSLKVNMDAVIEYLALLPTGRNEEKAAMALMAKFMSNGLASAFNFEGQGWKLAFSKTNAWKAVEGALAVQFKGSNLSDAIVKVKSWLRNAPKRDGGKPPSAFSTGKKD